MAEREYHGGECCGMTHIYEMTHLPPTRTLSEVDHFIGLEPTHHCFEIVLTDWQINNKKELVRGLKARGFKLVSRFLNDNSGNYCNVLHRYPLSGKGSGKKNSPWHGV